WEGPGHSRLRVRWRARNRTTQHARTEVRRRTGTAPLGAGGWLHSRLPGGPHPGTLSAGSAGPGLFATEFVQGLGRAARPKQARRARPKTRTPMVAISGNSLAGNGFLQICLSRRIRVRARGRAGARPNNKFGLGGSLL